MILIWIWILIVVWAILGVDIYLHFENLKVRKDKQRKLIFVCGPLVWFLELVLKLIDNSESFVDELEEKFKEYFFESED